MNELFLTKEQIEEFNYEQCQTHLKKLNKAFPFNKPLMEQFETLWPVLDEVVNTLLYIEERVTRFEDPRIPSMNPGQVKVKAPPPPKVKKGKPLRKYRINDVIYDSIHDAARKTGIKLQTLKTYVSRHSDRYGYIEN